MNVMVNWLINAIVIIVAGYLLPGIHISGFVTALAIALILGILNLCIRPILILLTLPLTIMTLGLFLIIINALIIMLTRSLVPGFEVDSFGWAILYSLIISIIHVVIVQVFGLKMKK